MILSPFRLPCQLPDLPVKGIGMPSFLRDLQGSDVEFTVVLR